MAKFNDSLRGYGHPIYERDGFRCQFCGFDGTHWPNWLFLTVDHLLPKGHADRDEMRFQVTACSFCNTADNQYFRHAETRGLVFDGMTPDQLVEQRKPFVLEVRAEYEGFWKENVKKGEHQSEELT
jgi:hypothetical protein